MPSVIVPVGLNLGPSYRYVSPPDPVPEYWEVRLGAESEELTFDEFQVWGRAFLDPERHARLEVSRETLVRDVLAAGKGPVDPDAYVDRLLSRGLLLEFDPEGRLDKVFRRFKLFPIAEGMGNTPEEPERYHIGHNGISLVKVAPLVFALWAASNLEESLWESCVIAERENRNDISQGVDLVPLKAEEAAYEVAVTLPLMIASGCAILDPIG